MKFEAWKRWANSLKKNTYALYLASKDPRVPVFVKILIGVVVAYALSPIDLIPDFIPIIGYLDDLLLLPMAVWLVIRIIPQQVWQECLDRAEDRMLELPKNPQAALVIVVIWIIAITSVILWLWRVTRD